MESALTESPMVASTETDLHSDDAELLRAYVQRGDKGAMSELFNRHSDSAFRLALRCSSNASDAEDAVQVAFLSVMRCASGYRAESSVRVWIMGVVVHACKDKTRAERTRKRYESRAEAVVPAKHQRDPAEKELADAALSAVNQLPKLYRLPVWLHYLEGLNFADASRVLALPENTVRGQANRGIEMLRQSLNGAGFAANVAGIQSALSSTALPAASPALKTSLHAIAVGGVGKVGGTASKLAYFFTAKLGIATAVVVTCVVAAAATMHLSNQPGKTQPALPVVGPFSQGPSETKGDGDAPAAKTPAWPAGKVVGWRGDGTGRYPDAIPVLHWGRVSKDVVTLRSQGKKPAGDTGGEAMADGVTHQWLVLGPFHSAEPITDAVMDKETVPNEAQIAPDVNEKSGDLAWKLVNTEGSLLDFNAAMGKDPQNIAFALTYIYADTPRKILMQCNNARHERVWLNGAPLPKTASSRRSELTLVKGWNRLLFKIGGGKNAPSDPLNDSWYINPAFYGLGGEYDVKNIRWMAPMPGNSCAAPIIVGSKVFTMAEPDLLICMDKVDGKILWIRSNNLFEAVSDADKKANPAFAEIEPLAAKVRNLTNSFVQGLDDKAIAERDALQKDIVARLRKIDAKKFRKDPSDFGFTGLTPTSDGQNVYVWMNSCVSACYDLNGNRKWIRLDNYSNFEHGFSTSPLLIGGKLICYMRDIVAIDAQTGSTAWTVKYSELDGEYPARFHGSFTGTEIGGTKVFISPEADIYRVADGKVLFHDQQLAISQQIASPVVINGVLYRQDTFEHDWPPKDRSGQLQIMKLPATATENMKISAHTQAQGDFSGFPHYYNNWTNASPLIHDGLAYSLNCSGILTVVDVAEAKVLYQKWLNLNQFESGGDAEARGVNCSPTLAGKYIFVTGNFGTTLVLKPGRTYEPIALNHIENFVPVKDMPWANHIEKTIACPVFDGARMYFRAECRLYCMEEKP
jgi:RNA polymerase sigma-70 factor (ECF subfamily)